MKKKMFKTLLSLVLVLFMAFTLTGCEESYSAVKTDSFIAELQLSITNNKTELDEKIEKLTNEYKEKDAEIIAKITINEQALANLKAEHEQELQALKDKDLATDKAIEDLDAKYLLEVEKLVKADAENLEALNNLKLEHAAELQALKDKDLATDKAIEDLDAKYLIEVEKLQGDLVALNEQLETNKIDLESQINTLNSLYESKFAELNNIIETLKSTDSSQQEIIEVLIDRITKLEQDFNDIHVHDFGELIPFGSSEESCEEKMFYKVCKTCNDIQFVHGTYDNHKFSFLTVESTCQTQGYTLKTCEICGKEEKKDFLPLSDHKWLDNQAYDDFYHCVKCEYCGESKNLQEHVSDNLGVCTICNDKVGASLGILYEDSAEGDFLEVVGYNGTAKNVVIPNKHEGKDVKTIGTAAFFGNSSITGVIISNSVIEIKGSAFNYCDKLSSVVFGENVASIGILAFANTSLKSIILPDRLTSLGDEAFRDCDINYNIKNGVKYLPSFSSEYFCLVGIMDQSLFTHIEKECKMICDYALSNCHSLQQITIPSSVVYMGKQVFCGVWGSVPNILIYCEVESRPETWDEKWNYSWSGGKVDTIFWDCNNNNITESGCGYIWIDNVLYGISNNSATVCGYDKTTDEINILDTITYSDISYKVRCIGYGAFFYSGLKSITIGKNIIEIAPTAFTGSSSLVSVVFTDTENWYSEDYVDYGDYCGSEIDVTSPSNNANLITTSNLYFYKLEKDFFLTTNTNNQQAGTYTVYTEENFTTGTEVTVVAQPNGDYEWLGWYNGETLVSKDLSYIFEMPRYDLILIATYGREVVNLSCNYGKYVLNSTKNGRIDNTQNLVVNYEGIDYNISAGELFAFSDGSVVTNTIIDTENKIVNVNVRVVTAVLMNADDLANWVRLAGGGGSNWGHGSYIMLGADLDATGVSIYYYQNLYYHEEGWGFTGTFDGNGHTISNLNSGLICVLRNTTIKNLKLVNCTTSAPFGSYMTGLKLENCEAEIDATNLAEVRLCANGVGQASSIKDCKFTIKNASATTKIMLASTMRASGTLAVTNVTVTTNDGIFTAIGNQTSDYDFTGATTKTIASASFAPVA